MRCRRGERLAGLYSRHRGQKPFRCTPQMEAKILNATRKPPTDGSTHWSTRRLAAKLGVSHMMVARVWNIGCSRTGWSARRSELRAEGCRHHRAVPEPACARGGVLRGQDFDTLERATGAVFQLLGFDYERKGGNTEGPDGILYARLGLHKDTLADYRLVYDAKQTNQPSVPADKVNFGSLEDFRRQVDAEFGFFIATAYQAESDDCGKLNRQFANDAHQRLTLLKVEHLRRLLDLHCRHGLTLTKLRALFEKARTVQNVHDWLVTLESELQEEGDLPVALLLDGLEREKRDPKATPNVIAVRAKTGELARFEPERLIARLKAVESLVGTRWIEVDNAGTVLMHHTAEQITLALERSLLELNDDTIEEYPHSS